MKTSQYIDSYEKKKTNKKRETVRSKPKQMEQMSVGFEHISQLQMFVIKIEI